jgi:hypothetical protein
MGIRLLASPIDPWIKRSPKAGDAFSGRLAPFSGEGPSPFSEPQPREMGSKRKKIKFLILDFMSQSSREWKGCRTKVETIRFHFFF